MVCTALTTAEVTKEAVAICLSNTWDVENNTKKAAWEEQTRQDEVDAAEARLTQDELEQFKHKERRKEDEAKKKEKEKKKPEFKDFITNKPVKDTTQLCLSCYAIHKLDEREYVELYYFTLEGCTEATKLDHTIAQDAFTFTKAEDTLLLKPMASHKPSNKAILDEDLTWRQMLIAKGTLLHHMSQTGWPENHIITLAEFYLNLESHPTQLQTDGDMVLLHYQAQVRREWHEALRSTSDNPVFDISVINDRCIETIRADLWNTRHTEGVLRFPRAKLTKLTKPSSFLLSPFPPPSLPPPFVCPTTSLAPLCPCTTCTLHPAPCTLHHAPCTTHPCIICTMYSHMPMGFPYHTILYRHTCTVILCPCHPAHHCTYIHTPSCIYTYALCFPTTILPHSPHSADIRLEEQLAKATLSIDNAQGS